jgi:hypothetical protein
MTLRPCPRGPELRAHLQAGHWPHACPAELRGHAAACRSCGDLVLLTQTFRADRAQAAASAELLPPGLLWWRAQLRRRNAAVQTIARPLLGAQIFAFAVALLVAVALVVSQARHGLHWLSEAPKSPAFHLSTLWSSLWSSLLSSFSPAAGPAQSLGLHWNPPYLVPLLALLVLLGGVVVYLATEKQ